MIKKRNCLLHSLIGICFAAPRSIAAYHAISGDKPAKVLASGRLPIAEDLAKLAVSRSAALEWGENAQYARDLARAYHAMRLNADRSTRKSLAFAVETASIRELGARPLNTKAWWRVAEMRDARFGPRNRKTIQYLLRSVEMQRNASTFMPARLNSIIRHWWHFDPESRQALIAQVMMTARADWKGLLRIAKNPRNQGVIRAGLVSDPQYLGALEAALYKTSRQR
jgi:hypothetical protein